jgi:ribonuclease HI
MKYKNKVEMIFYVYTDGASRGNPGDSGIAYVILDETKKLIEDYSEYIGIATNNIAEYTALLKAAQRIITFNPTEVNFYLDNELVVKQMNGEYSVSNPKLYPIHIQLKEILKNIKHTFTHIRRENNGYADMLAKDACYTCK